MKLTNRVSTVALSSAVALLSIGSWIGPAAATVSNDRDYRFGGAGSVDGSLGANVAEGSPIGFIFGGKVSTADETGTPPAGGDDIGSLIDVDVPGATNLSHAGATYTDTTSRPLAAAGEFGARFDGVDDLLTGFALNRPDEFASRLPSPSTYPIDYSNVTARGLQLWVRPDQAGLVAGTRQTIVMDTIAAGGVAITADGLWTQVNDGHASDNEIGATIAVTGDTWYHVMQHVYPSADAEAPAVVPGTGGDNGFTSVVYVDGVAVSANNDSPDIGDFDAGNRNGVLSVGAAELAKGAAEDPAVFGEFFDGTVDNLQLYVFQDSFGPFDLFADNEWIANEISKAPLNGTLLAGDINRDGAVTIAGDVTPFVTGWLSENRLVGAHNDITAGDWNTWGQGDMNHDGKVNLKDWAIINNANPALGAAIGAALSAVPEPTSAALLAVALLSICNAGRRRRDTGDAKIIRSDHSFS